MPPWGGYLCTREDLGGAGFAGGRWMLLKPGLFLSSTSALSVTCVPGFSPSSNRSDPVAYSVQFGSTVGDESCFGRRPGGAKVTW